MVHGHGSLGQEVVTHDPPIYVTQVIDLSDPNQHF